MRFFKIKFIFVVILLIAVSVLLPIASLQAKEMKAESVTLFSVNYPPYSIIRSDGTFAGLDVDVVHAAFLAVGINVEMKTAPWPRILKNIKVGHSLAAVTCTERPERSSYVSYSDQVSTINQVAVMDTTTDDRELIKFSDLSKFKVAVVGGWGIEEGLINAGIEPIAIPDVASGVNAVVNRGVDIFYSGETAALYSAQQLGVLNQIKTKKLQDKKGISLHLCFSKRHGESQRLIRQFNEGLSIIKNNGTYQAIHDFYLKVNSDFS